MMMMIIWGGIGGGGGRRGGGGISPVNNPSLLWLLAFVIAECTGTPSSAELGRDDCPRAELQPVVAWHFLHPVVDFAKQCGAKLWHSHTHTRAHTHTHTYTYTLTHTQRLPLWRVLCSDTLLRGFSFLPSGDLKLKGLYRRRQRRKTDGRIVLVRWI